MLRARETDGYIGNGTIVSNRKITRQKPYDTFLWRVAVGAEQVATNNKRKTQTVCQLQLLTGVTTLSTKPEKSAGLTQLMHKTVFDISVQNNNVDCRGYDLHDPRKDCSNALDSYRTYRSKTRCCCLFKERVNCSQRK